MTDKPITTLVERLRLKASVMETGEKIAWGSDTLLMREAAEELEKLIAYKTFWEEVTTLQLDPLPLTYNQLEEKCRSLEEEIKILNEAAAHNADLDRDHIRYLEDRVDDR